MKTNILMALKYSLKVRECARIHDDLKSKNKVVNIQSKETRKRTTCDLKDEERLKTKKVMKLLRGIGYNI